MSFASHNKSYAAGIRGSDDSFNLGYKNGIDADLDDTVLINVTSAGNVTATGTIAAATGSTRKSYSTTEVLQAQVELSHSEMRISLWNTCLRCSLSNRSWYFYRSDKCCYSLIYR